MADVLVCDEQLMFGEALAAVLRRRGATAVAARDLGALAQLENPGGVTRVVLGVDSSWTPSADDLDRVRATCPDAMLVCLTADLLGEEHASLASQVDVVVGKRQSLGDVVQAVLGGPAGTRPGATVGQAAAGRPWLRAAKPLPAQFLTARENEVLELLVAGESTRGIAHRLGVTRSTARSHVQSVLGRLGVHSRVEAVRYALFHDLVDPGPGESRNERTAP